MSQGAFSVPLTEVTIPEEDVIAVLDCLRSGWLTMGPRTLAFEAAFADTVGGMHAVAVSSGTAALHLALLAAGIGPGDEVLVPALTFVATAGAVRHCGAEPVLCDVHGPRDFNMDPADAARRITSRTKAIVAVHFMGYPADTVSLVDLCDTHGLTLLEDCAQSVCATLSDGRTAGTAGLAGAFSFFSKKQLCVGEGGMVVTADDAVARRVRSLRSHGMTSTTWDRHAGHVQSYDIVDVGFNYRLDEPRAALGHSRLGRLGGDIAARRAAVRVYRHRLGQVPGVDLAWDARALEASSHFAFPILVADRHARDALRERLAAEGIQTTWYPALTRLSHYAAHGSRPRAEEVADRHLALPLSASTSKEQIERVTRAVESALS